MKKLKEVKKHNPNVREIPLRARANAEEMRKILARAVKFTGGDVSKWLRYAAMNHTPKKEDLE